MNPWIIICFASAAAVFGLDFLLRRKKWKDNSKAEKISLLLNMFSVGPHAFLAALAALWGIVPVEPKTALGQTLCNATLMMGGIYFIIAIAAVVLSFVFRKTGKIKASIWVHVIAFVYIAAVLAVNSLAGKVL